MSDDLAALARAAADSGVFCDFDGCLATIVADPEAARPVPGVLVTLERLAARFRVVAVVSGRSVSDLRSRLRVRGVRLFGLHGLEELRDGEIKVAGEVEAARAAVERVASRLEAELARAPGAMLERKGLALAVHFRRARDPVGAERLAGPLVRDAAAGDELVVVPGRRILEVRPRAGGDKGDAIRRVIAEASLRGALIGGDDVGDLPAFESVEGLEIGIRVAVASDESPPALREAADIVVDSPRSFVALLKRLAD